MSTIKVDTIATRTGSGNIAISNNVTSLTTSALTATKIHPSSGTTTNYLSLDSSNELNFKNASNVSQTLFVNYDGGGVHLARGSVSVEADGSGTGNSVFGGNVRFGTAGKGIYLGTTGTTAANLLDDYEEGSVVNPVVKIGGTVCTLGSTNGLFYTKIGRQVVGSVEFRISNYNGGSGLVTVDLPFAAISGNYSANAVRIYSGTVTGREFSTVTSSESTLKFYNNVSGSATGNMTASIGAYIYTSFAYTTA
tara:strand:+ start:1 stop:753 length:753 start_codon:yes stop_codon:yes gene_type:complete